jgi:hypothetical protein
LHLQRCFVFVDQSDATIRTSWAPASYPQARESLFVQSTAYAVLKICANNDPNGPTPCPLTKSGTKARRNRSSATFEGHEAFTGRLGRHPPQPICLGEFRDRASGAQIPVDSENIDFLYSRHLPFYRLRPRRNAGLTTNKMSSPCCSRSASSRRISYCRS